jgi:cytochrome P450
MTTTFERARGSIGGKGPPGLYGARNARRFMATPLAFLEESTRAYGDVVRFPVGGKPWVLLNHPTDIETMFVGCAAVMGRDDYSRVLKRALGNGLLTSDGELWKRQRKLAGAAFTPKRIKSYAAGMASVTDRGLGRWKGGTTINLHDELSHLTMDVVADVLFGAGLTRGDFETVSSTMEVFNDYFGRSLEAFFLPPWLPTPRNRAMERALERIDRLVYRLIDERRAEVAKGVHRDDLLGAMVTATDETGGMDDQQLRDESITLFLAGHETTALALTHALYLVARHPDVEARMLAEIRGVLGERLPTEADVPRLAYTERVIREAMRLLPPAWLVGRESTADVEVNGMHFEKGTQFLVSQWIVHRDPRWFADPEVFDPDRFLPERSKDRPRFSYFPFGGGPRTCIGNHFAMMEAVLMLAIIARRFHVELLPHTRLELAPSVTLRPAGDGLSVRLVERPSSDVVAASRPVALS